MPIDPQNKLNRDPTKAQKTTLDGVMKGIVVDVRDPLMQGRVRVHAFQVNGHYKDFDINNLDWAEPKHANAGNFHPPELFQRVWVSFEGGDKKSPVYESAWTAIPMSRGTLPFDSTTGTEIRPEAWSSRDLYPEVVISSSTPEGNTIWIEHHNYNQENAHNAINLMDTGGKSIRIWSYHKGQKPYPNKDRVVDASSSDPTANSMDGMSIPASIAIRDGVTPVTEEVPGGIELSTLNVKRALITDENQFSVDSLLQYDDDTELTIEQLAVAGQIHRTRQGDSSCVLASNALFLSSSIGVFAPGLLSLPERWDI